MSMKDEYGPILRHKEDNVHVPNDKHELIQDLMLTTKMRHNASVH